MGLTFGRQPDVQQARPGKPSTAAASLLKSTLQDMQQTIEANSKTSKAIFRKLHKESADSTRLVRETAGKT